jgi:hypothetical protein
LGSADCGSAPTRSVGESAVRSSGVLGLERLQLAEQPVVLGVGQRRPVEHVVLVSRPLVLLAQRGGARGGATGRRRRRGGAAWAEATSRRRGTKPPGPARREVGAAARRGAPVRPGDHAVAPARLGAYSASSASLDERLLVPHVGVGHAATPALSVRRTRAALVGELAPTARAPRSAKAHRVLEAAPGRRTMNSSPP